MPLGTGVQLAGANAAVLLLAFGLGTTPRSTDRTVYVLRAPWLSAKEARRRVEVSGGVPITTLAASLVMKVALPSEAALSQLRASNGLVVTSASPMLCTKLQVPAR